MPPGKDSTLLTLVHRSCVSLPRKSGSIQTIHSYLSLILAQLGGYIYEAHFECHYIIMLGKSPTKWKQRPDMTIAVDWDVNH